MTAIVLALGFRAVVFGYPPVSDDEFPGNRYVKVRLALEESALTPGVGGHLAVIFDIAKGWHVYWRNAGDSGLPPQVRFELPPGVTVGAAQWPAPTRHLQPGDMVDYIFENQLVLIYPITVSEEPALGKNATIRADVDWLVCKDKCVPGRATVSAKFDVASSSTPSSDATLFAKTRERLARRTEHAAPYTTTWEGSELIIQCHGAKRLTFFPYENDEGVYPADLNVRGAVKTDTMRLSYPTDVRGLTDVGGMLAIDRDGRESFYELTARVPGRSEEANIK